MCGWAWRNTTSFCEGCRALRPSLFPFSLRKWVHELAKIHRSRCSVNRRSTSSTYLLPGQGPVPAAIHPAPKGREDSQALDVILSHLTPTITPMELMRKPRFSLAEWFSQSHRSRLQAGLRFRPGQLGSKVRFPLEYYIISLDHCLSSRSSLAWGDL